MSKLKIAVFISGNGTNLQALINACKKKNYPTTIVAVVSNRPDAYGLVRAQKAGIPTYVVDHKRYKTREAFEEILNQHLTSSKADFICLAGFMRLLTKTFVNKWYNKIINIHPSLLPAFKGAHAHEAVLDSGIKITGCTVHYVRPETDSGPIILQAAVPVLPGDTKEKLSKRVHKAEHICLPYAIKLIAEKRVILKNDRVTIKKPKTLPTALLINPLP